jgi:hypothetical protein
MGFAQLVKNPFTLTTPLGVLSEIACLRQLCGRKLIKLYVPSPLFTKPIAGAA